MLSCKKELEVRFNEVDSMGILWHGHHIKYFEDGREAFGKKYGLGYMDMHEKGFYVPLVNVQCDYKKPIKYKDPVMVEANYINTLAAKIIFEYKLYGKSPKDLYATGRTEQVFLTKERELHLTIPDFYAIWKKKWKL